MRSRRRFVEGLCLATVIAGSGLPAVAFAAEVSVDVRLGATEIGVGEAVALEVEVKMEGSGAPVVGEPIFPELEGLTIEGRGSFSGQSITSINGEVTRERNLTFKYLVVGNQPGEYLLDVEVEVSGTKHGPAKAPTLTVGGAGEVAAAPEADAVTSGARPLEANGDVFLWPVVDKNRAYVGEQLTYRFEVWERTRSEVTMRSMPTFKDFWTEELPGGEVRRESIRGQRYRVHPSLRRVLFPQRAGTLSVGGGEVMVSASPGLSFFRRSPRHKPKSIVGPPLEIEVLPLPAKGQPPGFSPNNVGTYEIDATVDRSVVAVGEAFALTVKLSGRGNMRLAEPDDWPELEGLRRYEPQVSEPELELVDGVIRGKRSYEFLVVGDQPGTWTIPAHVIHYFDPDKEVYASAQTTSIEIEVTGDASDEGGAGSETRTAGDEPDPDDDLLTGIIGADSVDRSEPSKPWLTHGRWLVGFGAVPVVGGLGVGLATVSRRLAADDQARARAEARSRRRALIAQAKASVDTGEGFYSALADLLQGCALERAGGSAEGLPRPRLMEVLETKGVSKSDRQAFEELLDACDGARFGGAGLDVTERRAQLERAIELVDVHEERLT